MFLDLHGLGEDVAPEVIDRELDIPLDDIGIEGQPRTEFDENLIQTMARQFNDPEIGQIEDIVVRENAGQPPYILIHGETRLKAARVAGLSTISAKVKSDGGFIRQLLSNETRGEMTLMDKALAYKQLIAKYGYEQKGVAELLGVSEQNITRHLHLIGMDRLVETAYFEGKATTVSVLDDLRLLINKHPKRHDAIEQFIASTGDISSRQIAELSKTLSKRKAKPKAPAKAAPMIDGKAFDVVSVSDDDVITVKLKGDKVEKQYRLVPVDQVENT